MINESFQDGPSWKFELLQINFYIQNFANFSQNHANDCLKVQATQQTAISSPSYYIRLPNKHNHRNKDPKILYETVIANAI